MDPNAVAATTSASSGLLDWISQYGSFVAFFAQILYWTLLIVLLGYAVFQYKRWVNFQLGTGRSGKLRNPDADAPAEQSASTVSVEEFVE